MSRSTILLFRCAVVMLVLVGGMSAQEAAYCQSTAEDYFKIASAYYVSGDYDHAWADVKRCRDAGGKPAKNLVDALTKASGKTE